MYIGEVSRRTGASVKAIRHYETLGLLGQVPRAGKYRRYTDRDVVWIKLIKQAQTLGFRLAELNLVLDGSLDEPDWYGLLTQIDSKQSMLRQEIARLQTLDRHLGEVRQAMYECLTDSEYQSPCDMANWVIDNRQA
ncbi:MerR family transcriptional regulator [Chitinivorax sp. B]|uniref:MerR family transcriptional regulator n=1 Tax=Chitinivorax sp. B TaxID=2502235 RepID=UPI0010F6DB37|nr:MerR family transcriptional regulator [Chitinivorax sp. B]